MKHLFHAALLVALLLAPAIAAEGPDDVYLGIYFLIEAGDKFADKQQLPEAVAKYTEAQTDLKNFKSLHPDWNPIVVDFRLNYLGDKIAAITPRIPPPPAPKPIINETPAVSPAPPGVTVNVANLVPAPQPPNDYENTIRNLQEQLRQAGADKVALQEKLREALSVQPAVLDPQELARAQDEIRQLQKENALFQTSLEQSRTRRLQIDDTMMANEELRRQLADVQQQMAQLVKTNATLAAEKNKLEAVLTRPLPAVAPDSTTAALRQENEVLKKRVAELSKKPAAPESDLSRKLAAAEAKAAVLQSDMDLLRLENSALGERVKLTAASPATAGGADGNAARIRQLEAERDGLQQRLDAALIQISAGKASRDTAAQVDETSHKLADLRARIDVLEARPVPYSAEELALISKPDSTALMAAVHSSSKSPRELPSRGAAMLSEAKQNVANHELDKAEAKYLEILKLDEKNVATLADLSSIQVDLDHTEDAEKHIKAALALEPNNEYSLFVLGRLKFREEKYDDALDALSRAAQLNPENAEIQNYLGITLSEKGQREPAEAALRKAVQIDPNYGSAHANLAFVYITQKPPLADLARWHYEKARATGYPPNLAIEKLITSATESTNDAK